MPEDKGLGIDQVVPLPILQEDPSYTSTTRRTRDCQVMLCQEMQGEGLNPLVLLLQIKMPLSLYILRELLS